MIKALEELKIQSQASGSDRLLLSIRGEVVLNESSGRTTGPIHLMSTTKSIVSLAIGILLHQKKIPSLDTPLSEFFPNWKTGLKSQVHLRHLLNHTSGIEAKRTTEDIYASPNFVQFALDSEVTQKPGEVFFYNNKATQILPAVVAKVSGKRLDHFTNDELFQPLGISDWKWALDSAGNPHGFAGLAMKAEDLLKVGELLLNRGTYNNHRLIDAEWVTESFAQAQPHTPKSGLLWWRSFHSNDTHMTQAKLFSGHGYLGQYLSIQPQSNLIAIRQMHHSSVTNEALAEFKNFRDLVIAVGDEV